MSEPIITQEVLNYLRENAEVSHVPEYIYVTNLSLLAILNLITEYQKAFKKISTLTFTPCGHNACDVAETAIQLSNVTLTLVKE